MWMQWAWGGSGGASRRWPRLGARSPSDPVEANCSAQLPIYRWVVLSKVPSKPNRSPQGWQAHGTSGRPGIVLAGSWCSLELQTWPPLRRAHQAGKLHWCDHSTATSRAAIWTWLGHPCTVLKDALRTHSVRESLFQTGTAPSHLPFLQNEIWLGLNVWDAHYLEEQLSTFRIRIYKAFKLLVIFCFF